jgi:hypothetical protein
MGRDLRVLQMGPRRPTVAIPTKKRSTASMIGRPPAIVGYLLLMLMLVFVSMGRLVCLKTTAPLT